MTDELARHNYVQGRTFEYIKRSCGEQLNRLPSMARELVALKVEVICAVGHEAQVAARLATRTVPIVMPGAGDPVGDGFIESFAHPGGNMTGLAVSASEIEIKQLEILIESLPRTKRVAYVVFEPFRFRPLVVEQVARLEAAAKNRGVQLQTFPCRDGHALDAVFKAISDSGIGAVVLHNHATIGLDGDEVAAIVLKHRLPTIMTVRDYAESGVLFTYDTNLVALYRRAGIYVAKILDGVRPADLPVELPTRFEFVINLKTASALGIEIPSSVMLRADELIR